MKCDIIAEGKLESAPPLLSSIFRILVAISSLTVSATSSLCRYHRGFSFLGLEGSCCSPPRGNKC
jgi:hypothetical protein